MDAHDSKNDAPVGGEMVRWVCPDCQQSHTVEFVYSWRTNRDGVVTLVAAPERDSLLSAARHVYANPVGHPMLLLDRQRTRGRGRSLAVGGA